MPEDRPHIVSHTSMRGIAAFLVIGYHLTYSTDLPPLETWTNAFLRGYLWVDFFFILSGFVMVYVYGPMGAMRGGEARSYYRARIARIYPLHLFTLTILVLFKLFTIAYAGIFGDPGSIDGARWGDLPFQLLLVHSWGVLPDTSWNIPSWSISAELFAYILFPSLLALLARARAATLAAYALAGTAFYVWIGSTTGDLDITVGFAVLRCLAGFAFGMVLACVGGVFYRLPDAALSVLQGAALIGIALCIETVANDAVVIVPFALLIGATAPDRGAACRLLRAPWLRRLGDHSYSIYLIHVPIITISRFFYNRALTIAGWEQSLLTQLVWASLVCAATVVLSAWTYRFIERPGRDLLMGRLPRRPIARAPAAP